MQKLNAPAYSIIGLLVCELSLRDEVSSEDGRACKMSTLLLHKAGEGRQERRKGQVVCGRRGDGENAS